MADAADWTCAIPATPSGLRQGLGELGNWLAEHGLPTDTADRALLVFEEVVTNICKYGFEDEGVHAVDVTGRIGDADLTLVFEDGGRAFDPIAHPAAKPPSSLDEAAIGGQGLPLVRAASRRLDYERTAAGRNRFIVTLVR
jgi:serine/threonine-protein kinase RsbW